MARCFCDDGEVTICTRRCGYCSGCLQCSINRKGGTCGCIRLKVDCKHSAFNPSFPNCRCDDGETTVCTRRCGHCGGCLSCHINGETGKCNCMNLKSDCKHSAFNPSFPNCRCDDGETTVCTRRCGHCGGCLSCHINGETGKCNCVNLKPDCEHSAFNPSFPDCRCDDGETTVCTQRCGHCGGCLSCHINGETGKCNCVNLKPDCEHSAFNPSYPDCRCDDGEITTCTRLCGYCDGCLSCHTNRETGKCNCESLKPDCEHFAFNPSFPDCRCDDGEITLCTRRCGYCDGCLSCYINRETGECHCVNLKPDCEHVALCNPSFPDCVCDDGENIFCDVLCGNCDGFLKCNVNQTTGECNCANLKPGCKHISDCWFPGRDDLIASTEVDSQQGEQGSQR